MSYLQKSGNKYRARIRVSIGSKRKNILIDLNTSRKSEADTRNTIVTNEETAIRLKIRAGDKTINDLMNIDSSRDWSWVKHNGTKTSVKIIDVQECVNQFLEAVAVRGSRPTTIESYTYSLRRFCQVVDCPISDVNEVHIDDFIKHLRLDEKIKSDVTINSNLKGARAMLKWAERRRYIDRCPHFEFLKTDVSPKWLTEEEYDEILNYEHYTDKRFRRTFKLYAETGMRLSEGFNGVVTEDDNGIWLVLSKEHSKSHNQRTIPLTEEQRDTIRMIQSLWIEKGCTESHIKYYSKVFKNVRNACGIDRNKCFHSLRHYFGKTMVIRSRGNIYYVSGLMGHSSVSVTEKYYVRTFDQRQTLKEFPALSKYLKLNNEDKSNNELFSGIPTNSNNANLRAN